MMTAADSSSFKARILAFVSAGAFSDPAAEEAAVGALLVGLPLEDLFGLVSWTAEDPEFQTSVLTAVARVLLAPRGSDRLAASAPTLALGLSSSAPKPVRLATAALLRKCASKHGSAEALLKAVPVVEALVSAVADDEVAVARDATETLAVAVSRLPTCGTPALLADSVATGVVGRAHAASLRSPAAKDNAVVQMRYADLLIRLATADSGLFAECAEQGALDFVPALVMASGDPLLQVHAPPHLADVAVFLRAPLTSTLVTPSALHPVLWVRNWQHAFLHP
jgi:hypothetical protein